MSLATIMTQIDKYRQPAGVKVARSDQDLASFHAEETNN
jgi:hypothetical protein